VHPQLIGALARERQADLLRQQPFRNIEADDHSSVVNATRRPIHTIRCSVGSALVVAGTRLMTP
jgi:hypothetical protein